MLFHCRKPNYLILVNFALDLVIWDFIKKNIIFVHFQIEVENFEILTVFSSYHLGFGDWAPTGGYPGHNVLEPSRQMFQSFENDPLGYPFCSRNDAVNDNFVSVQGTVTTCFPLVSVAWTATDVICEWSNSTQAYSRRKYYFTQPPKFYSALQSCMYLPIVNDSFFCKSMLVCVFLAV